MMMVSCDSSRSCSTTTLDTGIKLANTASIIFSGVDRQYTSSAIYFYDPTSGLLSTILEGESGDPFLARNGNQVTLFNRMAGQLNHRTFDPSSSCPTNSTQSATPMAEAGDPAAFVRLNDDSFLSAHPSAGRVLHWGPGLEPVDISASWTAPIAGSARISDIVMSDQKIYLLHQGLNREYLPDNSQSIIQLDLSSLKPIDADQSTSTIDHQSLFGSNPQRLHFMSDDRIATLSLCSEFLGKTCASGIDYMNPSQSKPQEATSIPVATWKLNGPVLDGGKDFVIASVKSHESSSIVRINLIDHSYATIHTFPEQSPGCCSLIRDTQGGRIFVGDIDSSGVGGQFSIYNSNGTLETTMPLPLIPYQGLAF